jgi:hypothetical protein
MLLSPIRLSVLVRIEDHMFKTGLSPDAFGRLAVGDHKIVPRIRKNLNVTFHRLEACLAFIDS